MKFSMLYPLYVSKAEKKGRHAEEVDEVICWLTGYTQSVQAIDELAKGKAMEKILRTA